MFYISLSKKFNLYSFLISFLLSITNLSLSLTFHLERKKNNFQEHWKIVDQRIPQIQFLINYQMYCNIIMILIINDFIKFSLQYSISLLIFAIWKRKSESLVINRKNQLPMPTLSRYPASDGIARSTIIHCTSVNSSSAKTRQNLADALDLPSPRFPPRFRPSSNKSSISLSLYSRFTSSGSRDTCSRALYRVLLLGKLVAS